MSDGSLIFDTKINEDGFSKGIENLKKGFSNLINLFKDASKSGINAFSGMSSSQMSLNNNIKQTANKINELKAKIKEIEGEKIATDQFLELQASIDTMQNKYDELIKKQQEWRDLGINEKSSLSMGLLSIEIQKVSDKLAEANARKKEMESSGSAYQSQGVTEESAKLTTQLEKEESRLSVLNTRLNEYGKKNKKASEDTKLLSSSQKKSANTGIIFAKQLGKIGTMLKSRLLRQVVTTIFNGIKSGFQNLVQYSTPLNKSISGLQGSFKQLNNALSTAFAPLISSVVPILQAVIDKVIEVVNVIAQLTTSLTSNATKFTKAKKVSTDYAKSLSSASKESKKLASFDTIEKLSDSSNSSSTDASQMFEESAIESDISSFADRLKNAVEQGDYASVGSAIAEKLNGVLDKIDLYSLTSSLGKSFNNAMSGFNGFLKTFDFAKVGKTLADGVNGMWESVDFKLLAETLSNGVSGAIETLYTFLEEVDWVNMGNQIWTFISNIDWTSIIHNVSEAIGAALGGLGGLLYGFFQPIVDDINKWWDEKLEESGGDVWVAFGNGLKEAIINCGKWLYDNVVVPIVEGFYSALGVEADMPAFEDLGTTIIDGIENGLENARQSIVDFFKGLWTTIVETVKGCINNIISKMNAMITALENALNWIVDKVNALKIVNPFDGETIWSPNLSKFKFNRVPYLASGTVVPANQGEFMAMLGDNNKETEVVSPLSTMKEALIEALSEANGSGSQTVILELNGQELGRAVYKLNKKESQRIGTSLRLNNGGAY